MNAPVVGAQARPSRAPARTHGGAGPFEYWVALLVALVTAGALMAVRQLSSEADAERFSNATETVQDSIRVRLDAYVSILRATRSHIVSQGGQPDLRSFRKFTRDLQIDERYPGIQGVGFSRRMRPGEVETVIADVLAQGQDAFRVWPDQPRDEYHAIIFLEPMDRRNRAALGYDMFTEAVRREAMARARDSGRPAASGRVTLVQEIDAQKQPGFLIYVPVYAQGRAPANPEARRDALLGFVYSPFRVYDLMHGIFGTQRAPRVAFDLYDGTEPSSERLLYRGIRDRRRRARHSASVPLRIAGRNWNLDVQSTPAFEAGSSLRLFPYLVAIGVLVNATVFVATRSQLRSRRRAAEARERLAVLAETSKRFSEAELDLPAVLRTVCREVAQRVTESCTINLLDAAGTRLELAEAAHVDPGAERELREVLQRKPVRLGETPLGQVAATGRAMLISAVPPGASRQLSEPEYRDYLERFPIASLVIVPLRVGERIIGALTAGRGPRAPAFTRQDEQLLGDIADRAALAIDNARLAAEQRAAMLEAQRAVRIRDEFLSIAGHELRTPLAALQLQVEGLLRQAERGAFGPAPRLIERLGKARAHVGRLDVLIGGLLDVSRIAAGRLALSYEDVDVVELLEDVVERFGEQLSRAQCTVRLNADGPVIGRWDRSRLDQVFTNLVSNALKYGSGKPIDIDVVRREERARVAVRDRGIGISPDDQGRIFERFERAVSDRNYGGLGLGLWITDQIVRALGGRIELTSELGQGSTFSVELPLRGQEIATNEQDPDRG